MRRRTAFMAIALLASLAIVALLTTATDVAAVPHVELTYIDDTDEKVQGTGPVTFNFTIEVKEVTFAETVTVTLVNETEAWSHQFQAVNDQGYHSSDGDLTLVIGPSEQAFLHLILTPPDDPANGTYYFTVRMPGAPPLFLGDEHRVAVVVPYRADWELELWLPPPGGEYRAIPPATVDITILLYNKGNGRDQFRVTLDISLASEGWGVSFPPGADVVHVTDLLDPDPWKTDPYKLVVAASIPYDAPGGRRAQVTVDVEASQDLSAHLPPLHVPVVALEFYDFRVDLLGSDHQDAVAGSPAQFRFRVHNLGNAEDTYNLTVLFDEDLSPGFSALMMPEELTIDHHRNATTTLVIDVPIDAPKKTYFFTVEFRSSDPRLNPNTKSVSLDVVQYYAATVTCEHPVRSADPGDSLEFEVLVENGGNGLDTFIMWTEGLPMAAWLVYLQPPEVTLLQYQSANMTLTVIVPSAFKEAPSPSYAFDFVVSSSRGPAVSRLNLRVDLNRFWRLEWTVANETVTSPIEPVAPEGTFKPKPVIDIYHTNGTYATVRLVNLGTGTDNVTVSTYVDDPRIRATVVPSEATLLRGQEMEFTVHVVVPENMPPGDHLAWVNASSEDPGQAVRAIAVAFHVVPIYSPVDFDQTSHQDPLDDEYRYSYRTEGDDQRVVWAEGRRGEDAALDIVSLVAYLDLETNTVRVALEVRGRISSDAGVYYAVHFVNADHRLRGALLDVAVHTGGDYVWDTHDAANSTVYVYLAAGEPGSSAPMEGMEVTVSSDKVMFAIPARGLRGAGVVSGSDIRIYAYCHRLGGTDESTSEVTWDTAGTGAAPAPAQLTFEASDTPGSSSWVAIVVVVLVATLVLVQWFRRDFPFRPAPAEPGKEPEEMPEEEPEEMPEEEPEEVEWIEFE